uniref:Sortase family protein n=1 Tax=Solibacter usitatus (strain Ellin6076) TaxID=234267 RepID=Q022W4_SOLUE
MRGGAGLLLLGAATCLLGAVLGVLAWTGQDAARADWEARTEDGRPADAPQELTRLSLPAQGADFFVWEGATKKNLLFGPVHVSESAAPGGNGNCIIAAHRDTHFRILREVRKDEPIVVEHGGHVFRYRITGLHIVSAADKTYYRPTTGPTLTLVTCYPFVYVGRAPKRFIVQAELLTPAS